MFGKEYIMVIRILIAEDDPDINRLLGRILTRAGYEVTAAFSGSEARLLKPETFDLVLLDLMLPGATGEKLIEETRKVSTVPIIVISAKGQEDKLKVLKSGADDFISKPFDVEEVEVRVQSLLRRSRDFSAATAGEKKLTLGKLILDPESREAEVDGKPLTLTAREFDILALLLRHPNKVFTRQNLFEVVWGEDYLGDDNTMNVHVSNLRSKLQKLDPEGEYIATVWGVGFKAAKQRQV